MECFKDGDNIESITLQGKTFFVFGRNQARVDLTLMHESISREHVVLLFDAQRGCLAVDLGSTSGT